VLGRYAEAAVLMTGDPAASIEDGLAWIRETVASLQIPGLAAFGLRPAAARERASGSSASGSGDIGGGDIGEITAKAMRSSSMQGNPVALSTGDLRAILARAA
jgi:alcohol dehydrogenase class IV